MAANFKALLERMANKRGSTVERIEIKWVASSYCLSGLKKDLFFLSFHTLDPSTNLTEL